MTIQSQSVRASSFLVANASYGIYPPPTVNAALLELMLVQNGLVAQTVGLGRPATLGVPTVPVLFQQDDPADPASVTPGHLTWGAQPTAPTSFFKRWNTNAGNGVGIIWTFPWGLIIPGGTAMVLWNITVTQAMDVTAVLDS